MHSLETAFDTLFVEEMRVDMTHVIEDSEIHDITVVCVLLLESVRHFVHCQSLGVVPPLVIAVLRTEQVMGKAQIEGDDHCNTIQEVFGRCQYLAAPLDKNGSAEEVEGVVILETRSKVIQFCGYEPKLVGLSTIIWVSIDWDQDHLANRRERF
jgi:hypothetical protein